tara:strand:+ start:432 stop:1151 length:720 start_codon:yes stop_codon:yes gene_type:complete
MNKPKNIKIMVGLFYILLLFIFLYFLFSKFSLEEITNYKFIQTNTDLLINLKDSNIFLVSFIFIIFTTIWVLMLGFGSPIILVAGFIFGKWFGAFLSIASLSIGATFLYIFSNYFLKNLVKDKFLTKFKNLEIKFKNNEFIFFLIYRFVGGIPFQIANILPVLFNVRLKNYFFGTFLGMLPQGFIIASLGNGIEQIIKNNESMPSFIDLLLSREIYIPIVSFVFLVVISIFIRRFFYKN